jgi:competence protein ComEA
MPQIRRSQLALYALAALVVLVLGVRYLHRQAAAASPSAPPGVVARAPASSVRIERPADRTALVHVTGAVRRPGVYRLREGARVQDAVERAGGALHQADVDAINLASRVADGQQIVVPRHGRGGATAGGVASVTGQPAPAGAPVDLNTASAEQLDTLDGVGPAIAQRILEWRRQHGGFRSVDDLSQVPGIGPKRMAALRDKVRA